MVVGKKLTRKSVKMNRDQIAARINNKVLEPVRLLIEQERLDGIVLAISVLSAVVLANTAPGPSYHDFFQRAFGSLRSDDLYFNLTFRY